MNIFYGIAFLLIIYYIFQWKDNSKLLANKLSVQHEQINNKIQSKIAEQISNDTSLIEGFSSIQSSMTNNSLFSDTNSKITDKRNNCNSMFLPDAYKGVYRNEIIDGMYNYSSMKKLVNL